MKKALLLADEFAFKKFQKDEIEYLRDLSSIEIIQRLKIPIYKIPMLIAKMRQHLHHEMPTLMPITGIRNLLERFHQEQFILGILSSNSLENVEKWLDTHNMRHFFAFIHVESRYFSKKQLIKKTLSKYKIDRTKVVYIGDETRDIDAARKNNIQSIGVTWGYNSEKAISKYAPSFVAKEPNDIFNFFNLEN